MSRAVGLVPANLQKQTLRTQGLLSLFSCYLQIGCKALIWEVLSKEWSSLSQDCHSLPHTSMTFKPRDVNSLLLLYLELQFYINYVYATLSS